MDDVCAPVAFMMQQIEVGKDHFMVFYDMGCQLACISESASQALNVRLV